MKTNYLNEEFGVEKSSYFNRLDFRFEKFFQKCLNFRNLEIKRKIKKVIAKIESFFEMKYFRICS